jgi:peptidoglycan hydrolase-like protein with peptidoglycan-binding domain
MAVHGYGAIIGSEHGGIVMAVILRPGDNNDLVRVLQARLNRDYPLYSHLVVDGDYGPATTAVVREFQRRAGLAVDGIAGPQTLGRLGLNFEPPESLPTDLPFFYTAAGTWGTPFQGPPFDVGFRLEQMRTVRNQPVGYPAIGFLNPDPFTSYNESAAQGIAELVRLILMNAGKFYLAGYSQGAEVVVRTLRLMLPGQPLAHRAGDLLKVITFGSPCRPPGPTLLGNNPPGSGISRVYTPDVFRSRTFDFVIDGDMYATTTDDTLLHLAYEALTALELELPFAVKVLTLIQTNEFLALLNLANTPETFAKVVRTAFVVGDFLVRNPHIHYHDWLVFNGQSAVDRAVQIVASQTL